MNASPRDDELASTVPHQDWNATPTEGNAPQSSYQADSSSQASNSAQPAEASQGTDAFTASFLSAVERGLLPKPASKRVRGPGKAKSPAAKAKEDSPLPDIAGVTPPGPAEELSSSSGDTKKAKGPRTNQKNTAGQQNLSDAFAKILGSEL